MGVFLAFLLCIETVMHSYEFHHLVVMEVTAFENESLIGVGAEPSTADADYLRGSAGFCPLPAVKDADPVDPRYLSVWPYHRTIWEPPRIS